MGSRARKSTTKPRRKPAQPPPALSEILGRLGEAIGLFECAVHALRFLAEPTGEPRDPALVHAEIQCFEMVKEMLEGVHREIDRACSTAGRQL
jgi:hypothetical protein